MSHLFEWSTEFATGVTDVDDQHERLIDIINTLLALHSNSCTPLELETVLQQLQHYARYHFHTEEVLMARNHVSPDHQKAHLAAHKGFFKHLGRVTQLIETSPDLMVDHLLSFLVEWLIHHITQMDMEMAREVLDQSVESTSAPKTSSQPHVLVNTANQLYEGLGRRSLELLESNLQLNREIEQRTILEARLRRMSALYMALSKTNQAVAFRYDRDSLLKEVCSIVTEYSGFAAASIAILDPDSNQPTLIASSSTLAEQAGGEGRGSAGGHSILPSAVFPLQVEGNVVAILTVYCHEPEEFEEPLVAVLKEMATVISFGLESLEREDKRRNAEARLRDSEARLRAITEAAADAIVLTDAQGQISFWNSSAERIFGYSADEALGQQAYALIGYALEEQTLSVGDPMDIPSAGKQISAALSEPLIARRKGGQTFPVEVSLSHCRIQDGWNTVSVVRDITLRKRAQLELLASQTKLARLMDLVPLIIYIHDLDSCGTVYVNQAVQAATGYTPEEILSLNSYLMQALAEPEDVAAIRSVAAQWPDARDGEVIEYECRIKTKDGNPRHIACREVVIARTESGRPQQILGVAMDMTVRVWQRLMQEEKLADFSRIGRLVNMGEMASALAHELNQPLAAIANFNQACANLLRNGKAKPEVLEQALSKTAEQALRAGSIIQTMREFMRKREAKPAELDINEAVREVIALANIRSRTRPVEFSLRLDQTVASVWADRILVEQVLMNLLRNAEEAMGGTPLPEIQIETGDGGSGFVKVSIRDFGIGLPDGFELDKLPTFYTTKADGTGVGLGICRSIVEASGGKIWAMPGDQQGSVFEFTLPIKPADGNGL
ncbi:PAS domain S-box protein [Dechloromonas sp. XY25]|uniref:histidine kinase n=1 Tax=Dechloromonas hankyongensis TaxID=2908002 RepID=A0ABS9K452_9RHOO|nr:PAS domain S-box protein [Dechloromonas hankyongensis]MCG2577952.1 PAS domain S-box protein [Dechloromonas hankyongensis]